MAGITTQGATLEVGDGSSPPSFTEIGSVVDINGPTSSRGEVETTALDSTAKEFLLQLKDQGELSLTVNYKPGDTGQQLLQTLFDTEPPPSRTWKITLPTDSDAGHSTGTVIEGTGRVSGMPFTVSTDSKVEREVTIRNTGDVTVTHGS